MNKSVIQLRSEKKVLTISHAAAQAKQGRRLGAVIGLCHGCFDILHLGHLYHFEQAAANCDLLIISVTPDRYVNKGPNRPVFPAEQRAGLIAGLAVCDIALVNEYVDSIPLIETIEPSVYFKGEEYESGNTKFAEAFQRETTAVLARGGVVQFTRGWTTSSTSAIQRIISGKSG